MKRHAISLGIATGLALAHLGGPPTAGAKVVNGKVVAVVAEDSLAVVDVGKKDGLHDGMEIALRRRADIKDSKGNVIFKDFREVGTLLVIESEKGRALTRVMSGELPRQGDPVTFESEGDEKATTEKSEIAIGLVGPLLEEWRSMRAKRRRGGAGDAPATGATQATAQETTQGPPGTPSPGTPGTSGPKGTPTATRIKSTTLAPTRAIAVTTLPSSPQTIASRIVAKAWLYDLGAPEASTPAPQQCPAPKNAGWWQDFQMGSVTWTPEYGARAVRGNLQKKWLTLKREQGQLGFPTTDEISCSSPSPHDRFQIFEGGRILWRASAKGALVFYNPTHVGEGGDCRISVTTIQPIRR